MVGEYVMRNIKVDVRRSDGGEVTPEMWESGMGTFREQGGTG